MTPTDAPLVPYEISPTVSAAIQVICQVGLLLAVALILPVLFRTKG